MKKFIAVIAAICLCISFVSCNKEREKEMSTNPDVKQDIKQKNKESKETENKDVPSVSVPEKEKSEIKKEENTDLKTEEKNNSAEAEVITPPSPEEFFPTVAKEFVYEDGDTKTVLKMQEDGTFTGVQTVTKASETGDNYPNGTKTECHFSGKFTMALPLDEFTYISVLENYTVNNPSSESKIKDNTKYVYTQSSTLSATKEVVFYMPGAPTKAISDEFLKHMPNYENLGEKLPENLYGIFDMNNKLAFHSNN